MKRFNKIRNENIKRLEQYVPVVARVHGGTHPEFHKVHKVFDKINLKLKEDKLELNEEFKELREITDNYTVPTDVCETYEAVYNMLYELDKAYSS